jgi:hypothetical protein
LLAWGTAWLTVDKVFEISFSLHNVSKEPELPWYF